MGAVSSGSGPRAGHSGSACAMQFSSRRPVLSLYQTGNPSVAETGPTDVRPGPLVPGAMTAAVAMPPTTVRAAIARASTFAGFLTLPTLGNPNRVRLRCAPAARGPCLLRVTRLTGSLAAVRHSWSVIGTPVFRGFTTSGSD